MVKHRKGKPDKDKPGKGKGKGKRVKRVGGKTANRRLGQLKVGKLRRTMTRTRG